MSVIHVSESAEFKKLISTGVSLVDFSATWCGPCKRVEPVFKDLAKENPNIKFIHIDIDEAAETMANELSNVTGVPHFELYHNGEKLSQFAGANLVRIKESVETLKLKLEPPKVQENKVEEKKEEKKEEEAKAEQKKEEEKKEEATKEEEVKKEEEKQQEEKKDESKEEKTEENKTESSPEHEKE